MDIQLYSSFYWWKETSAEIFTPGDERESFIVSP